jgi:hypothetical protein
VGGERWRKGHNLQLALARTANWQSTIANRRPHPPHPPHHPLTHGLSPAGLVPSLRRSGVVKGAAQVGGARSERLASPDIAAIDDNHGLDLAAVCVLVDPAEHLVDVGRGSTPRTFTVRSYAAPDFAVRRTPPSRSWRRHARRACRSPVRHRAEVGIVGAERVDDGCAGVGRDHQADAVSGLAAVQPWLPSLNQRPEEP